MEQADDDGLLVLLLMVDRSGDIQLIENGLSMLYIGRLERVSYVVLQADQ